MSHTAKHEGFYARHEGNYPKLTNIILVVPRINHINNVTIYVVLERAAFESLRHFRSRRTGEANIQKKQVEFSETQPNQHLFVADCNWLVFIFRINMPFIDKNSPCARAIYKCSRCCRVFDGFDSKERLIQHLEHSSSHRLPHVSETCTHCRRSFSDTNALIQHLLNNKIHSKDLHHAACTGRFQVVNRLMRQEWAASLGDSHRLPRKHQTGYTPMHCAAYGGHYHCLRIMLGWQDGDPNVVDPTDGRTPVHLAAWKGNSNCFKLLLRNGGDIHLRDKSDKTPVDLIQTSATCWSVLLSHVAARQLWILKAPAWKPVLTAHPHASAGVEQSSQDVCPVQQAQVASEEPCSEPFEVLARGEATVRIFNQALREGKAKVGRMQLTVVGNVGAGKTSLVRTLSGEEFVEERQETHGIETSMVEITVLDDSWRSADLNRSHVDDILSDRVCQGIKSAPVSGQGRSVIKSRASDPGPSSLFSRLPSIEAPPTIERDTSMIPVSPPCGFRQRSRSEISPPRDLPVEQITKKLSEIPFNYTERKYTKISVWDFAGHPLYEAMHHVFLNKRSFFLVVTNLVRLCSVNTRDEALEELHFWLNSVRVHTLSENPIFLVGTHRDQVSEQDISDAKKTLYDEFVKTFGHQLVRSQDKDILFAVDNTLGCEDDGTILLRKAIEEEASLLDDELPVLWLHFEEKILKYRETEPECLSCVPKSFLRKMIESDFPDVDQETFSSMLSFYHDSGVIILPDRLDMDRLHSDQWQALQDRGITDISFLEHVWKDYGSPGAHQDSPVAQLIGILEAFGMLCPMPTLGDAKNPEQTESNSGGTEAGTSKYIVPLHLKDRNIRRKWDTHCRKTWNSICNQDKVLVFDFHNFLPPALFNYFIVRTGAKSKSTNGMTPIITKQMAIFSFGDIFFVFIEALQKHNQIKISARYKNGKKLHELFSILLSIMTDICQRQFRFLKFSFGPVCPNKRCPGASSDGKVLSSSDESDDGETTDGNSTCDESDASGCVQGESRFHVISIDPSAPSKPLWCNRTPVHEFEEITQWFREPQNTGSKVPEDSLCYSMQVSSCCLVMVAKKTADKWKWLGRSLDVPETKIKNIEAENDSQEERCYQVLYTWLSAKSSKATAYCLLKAVQDLGNAEAMETFDIHLNEWHRKEISTQEEESSIS
ncbi:uncharacterized protein [Montipora foliosa]|uniref:uncharacterized protein isoform X2 n=1 Tax=Montipora foliosa TaxID=591990 RepID=UPI0035F20417